MKKRLREERDTRNEGMEPHTAEIQRGGAGGKWGRDPGGRAKTQREEGTEAQRGRETQREKTRDGGGGPRKG